MLDRRAFIGAGAALTMTLNAEGARADDNEIAIGDLYHGGAFTPRARDLEGASVTMAGYMAPLLRAQAKFFVLGETPMTICPFCDADAEWPETIIAVYTRGVVEVAPFYRKIAVTGVLRLGAFDDTETGFVSQARIEKARYALI